MMPEQSSLSSAAPNADVQCALGRLWQKRDKPDKAIASYYKALQIDPLFAPAYAALAAVLRRQDQLDEAVAVLQKGLEICPNSAELHKDLVTALIARAGLGAAYDFYQLERQDNKQSAIATDDILCCLTVRDEAERLPFLLQYYRRLGVNRFLVVDNGSTDSTPAFLNAQPDVYSWRSPRSFNQANFGAAWFEVLLRQYGAGHWCLIVDADELFVYSGYEHKNLALFCDELDKRNKRAVSAVLLDMYSDRAINATYYAPGESFLDVCPFFDQRFFHTSYADWGPYRNQSGFFGGVRQRMFGDQGAYNISKVPLLKYDLDCVLAGGQHWTNLDRSQIAAEAGCLLHFKYFATFPDYVKRETERAEHYDAAMQYRQYAAGLANNESLSFYSKEHSLLFTGSQQLLELGVIKTLDDAIAPQDPQTSILFPAIAQLAAQVARPFWSVMITAYTRTDYLTRALRSVLSQAPDAANMQIEVINDAADANTVVQIEAIVRDVGGDRVLFYRVPEHRGHPAIFNLCLERALGHWVHILHDDDFVAPGFYAALAAGVEANKQVGAAFCRHTLVDDVGATNWTSRLERETPGVITDWLDRIAVMCRTQFAAFVAQREAYEAVGGFSAQAGSAFDWDMWKRLALHYSVWYEPRVLAYFQQGEQSETHRLNRSGAQISDALKSIRLASYYLPADRAAELSRKARQNYAVYALELARQHWRRGELQAAINTLSAGIECNPTHELRQSLEALLAQTGADQPQEATRG